MGVIVQIRDRKAFLRHGVWWSADLELEARLNELTDAWIRECGGAPLSSPDPELATAREIARRAGGKALLHAPGSARQLQRQYFSRRQYRLPF